MIRLRDGSEVEDARLDRLVQFDENSRKFPIRSLFTPQQKMRSYTWNCDHWLNQGRQGACVMFALGHELVARPARAQPMTYEQLIERYHQAQREDYWQGGSYPGASPFYEGTSLLAGIKVLQREGWFEEYRWAFGIDDLIRGVGHNGPAVLGINWYQGMYAANDKGFIKPTGRWVGGHAILDYKVNIKEEYFDLHNSWGRTSFGPNGRAKVSFKDTERLLNEDGEAAFLINRKSKIQ